VELAAIVLAAGGAERMGSAKQLLRYRGASLVRRAVNAATASGCDSVCVVVGSRAAELSSELEGSAAKIVANPRWAEGLSTSIAAGVAAVTAAGAPAGILLLLADQPHVTSDVVDALIEAFDGRSQSIVASAYSDTPGDSEATGDRIVGVPALFGRGYFTALQELTGDRGARPLLERERDRLRTIRFDAGAIDIDTPDDYLELTRFEPTRRPYSKK
jgi:molybdenum cofactor cytidylyltransferase